MESFDPSPRASKRRRTGTYATRRTTLNTLSADPVDGPGDTAQQTANLLEHDTYPASNGSMEEAGTNEGVDGEEKGTAAKPHPPSQVPQGQDVEDVLDNSLAATSGRVGSGNELFSGRSAGGLDNAGQQSTRKRRRDSARASAASPPQEVAQLNDNTTGDHDDEDQTGQDETPAQQGPAADTQLRSSGRLRRPPSRYTSPQASTGTSASAGSHKQPAQRKGRPRSKPTVASLPDAIDGAAEAASPKPKGILTPSRHGRDKRIGPRKSVAFDQNDKQIEEQFGFKDIDNSSTKQKKAKSPRASRAPTGEHLAPQKVTSEQQKTAAEAPTAGELGDTTEQCDNDGDDEDDLTFDMASDMVEMLSLSTNPSLLQQQSQNLSSSRAYYKEDEDNVYTTRIKTEVISRMNNRTLGPICQLESQYNTLHALLLATITAGESNSLLLLGSRGSGKSLLTEHAIADLRRSYGDEFHVVRLNGFFQTDDKVALREIWRQLGREMAVPEDETGEVSSYADTMASLLSLLSHPEEFAVVDHVHVHGHQQEEEGPLRTAAKSVIFILDEFDLFTTHPRQTLLYNLFDIAQAKKAPIAVIGCSCRMDVVDCLEKRVKSRFSHRWLHVSGLKTLSAFTDAVATVLCVPVEGKEALGVTAEELEWRARWNQTIKTRLLPAPASQVLLRQIFYTTKSIPDVLMALYHPVALLDVPPESEDIPASNSQDVTTLILNEATTLSSPPSLLTLLPYLPTLHLTLLICAARLETIHDLTTLNFAIVHAHYTELLTRSKMQRSVLSSLTKGGAVTGAALRSWSKETARAAWEELMQWDFLVPASGLAGSGTIGKLSDEALGGDGAVTKLVRVDVTLDEVAWAVKEKLDSVGPVEILEKWCKEV
ncbi:Origin recognition complex subunit 4 [Exophiala dermatitidis]